MKVLHRQPPEPIPSRSPLFASARHRCLPFFAPISYRTRAICGDIHLEGSRLTAARTVAVALIGRAVARATAPWENAHGFRALSCPERAAGAGAGRDAYGAAR